MNRVVLLALVLAAGRAGAQPNPGPSDPAALEASGSKHFELAEYTAAIADFKEAFRISDRPELLFNIAQAYRLAGDCVQARTFYKTYLRRLPDAANAGKVRERIDELEACANRAPIAPTEPAPPVPVTGPTTPPPTPSPHPPAPARTWKTKAGLGALGAGALGVGVGVVFAARGRSKADQLRDACAIECTGDTARTLDAAGRAANRDAAIGLVAGGALLAAGVVLIAIDRPRESGPTVGVSAHGATASWRWQF